MFFENSKIPVLCNLHTKISPLFNRFFNFRQEC
jgi:hypothetical protein